MTSYTDLRGVDVSKYIEHKEIKGRKLSYLSWAWAVDQLLQRDPNASWSFQMFDLVSDDGVKVQRPYCPMPVGYMVFCTVNAFGVTRTAQLPVLDHRNSAVENPDSFDINVSMQRCLAKAISLHGLGINLYAGEDIPLTAVDLYNGFVESIAEARDLNELLGLAKELNRFAHDFPDQKERLLTAYSKRKHALEGKPTEIPQKGAAGLKQRLANQSGE